MSKVDINSISDKKIEKIFLENEKEIFFTNGYYITYDEDSKKYQINSELVGLNIIRADIFSQALEYIRCSGLDSTL